MYLIQKLTQPSKILIAFMIKSLLSSIYFLCSSCKLTKQCHLIYLFKKLFVNPFKNTIYYKLYFHKIQPLIHWVADIIIAGGSIVEFIPLPGVLVHWEIQAASYRNRTQITTSTSY